MGDVAADGNRQPVDAALVAADRIQRIEQRLGRMFVAAVAGIDDRTRDFCRDSNCTAPE